MSFPTFSKIIITQEKLLQGLNQLQDQLVTIFTALLLVKELNARYVIKYPLIAGQVNHVPHTLNKTLSGYDIIRRRNVPAIIWDTQDANTNPQTYLDLWTDTNISIDVKVW